MAFIRSIHRYPDAEREFRLGRGAFFTFSVTSSFAGCINVFLILTEDDLSVDHKHWLPYLVIMVIWMHLLQYSTFLPCSSPTHVAMRSALLLLRFLVDLKVIGVKMKQPGMLIIAYVAGITVAHLLEYQQRSDLLARMTLDQQHSEHSQSVQSGPHAAASSVGQYAANEEEMRLLERLFSGQRLPRAVLQARVDLGDLQLQHTIGHGSFGQVNSAIWHGLVPRRVAMKMLYRNRFTEDSLSNFIRAVEIELALPPHPNIARLLGVAWSIDTARLVVISEYCAGGTLAKALTSGETAGWSGLQKCKVMVGLCEGLDMLHSQEPCVLHRDLKPPNVLFTEGFHAKICDFGASRPLSEGGMTATVGTPLFSAPELLHTEKLLLGRGYDQGVDVWALGCIFACLCNDSPSPYHDPKATCHANALPRNNSDRLLAEIATGAATPQLSPKFDLTGQWPWPLFGCCVRDCCQYDPCKRITARALLLRLSRALLAHDQ